jgi:hypothetical protein
LQARIRLVLDFPYHKLVPQDPRERGLLKQHLSDAIAASTGVDPSRVRILELRPGSVIVIASIRPDPKHQDLRDTDDLLSILKRDANNPHSELCSVYRLVAAEHARHSEAARAAAEGETSGLRGGPSPSPYDLFGRQPQPPYQSPSYRGRTTPSVAETPHRPRTSTTLPMLPMPIAAAVQSEPVAVQIPEEQRPGVKFQEEDQNGGRPSADAVDGLLEVLVLEACNLPTAEFTRAFAVLQVRDPCPRCVCA